MSNLQESINFSDLINGGTVIKIKPDSVSASGDWQLNDSDNDDYDSQKFKAFESDSVPFDEATYEPGESFAAIAKTMINLLKDGKIKKRILRKGSGDLPQDLDTIKIHYNAYLDFEMEPYDSTYNRDRPHKFIVNDGRVIEGLDIACQSMQVGEKAEFLIHPDYAYGKHALIGRIPADAHVLFQIELIELIKCGAALTYNNLPDEDKKSFSEIAKYAEALGERGKSNVKSSEISAAIKDYNTAVYALLEALTFTPQDSMVKKKLLLKFYTNLMVCYTKNEQPRKCCTTAKTIYDLTENGELIEIPIKVFYHHGKCLRLLGEYEEAQIYLEKAARRNPQNREIIEEMCNLETDKAEHKSKQAVFAKALVSQ